MASITRRGDRWLAQVRRKGLPPQSRTFPTKASANEWAIAQEAQLNRTGMPVSWRRLNEATLGDILERYEDEITPRKKSAPTEIQRIKQLRRDRIAYLTLFMVDAPNLCEYRDRRLQVVQPGTVKRELAIISHALEVARKEWQFPLTSNPAKQIRQPEASPPRERRLSRIEYIRLMDSASKARCRAIHAVIDFAIETAMRRSEIASLSWDDIDLENRIVRIRQSKNGLPRMVPLTDRALAIVQRQPMNESLVFGLSPNAIRLSWGRVIRRANICDLRFHDLRHEAISRFAEMGLSTVELATISGHRDPRMLFRYTHLSPERLAKQLAGRSWEEEQNT